MHIDLFYSENTALLKIDGQLQRASRKPFKTHLKKRLARQTACLTLELQDLAAIDYYGLKLLSELFTKLTAKGTVVHFSNIQEQVRCMLALTGLDQIFKIAENQQTPLNKSTDSLDYKLAG